MATALIVQKLISLPPIDFGKIRSWLKVQPTRPNSDEGTAELIASVWNNPDDRLPSGMLFKLPDARVFVVLVDESHGDLRMDCVWQVFSPAKALAAAAGDKKCSFFSLGQTSDNTTDHDVRRLIVNAYYGKKAPQKLIQFSLA